MLRLGMAAMAAAALVLAEGFSFTIGNPVAAGDFQVKASALVFRTEGCADPAKAKITATAEGLVKSERRTLPLKISTTSKAGVWAVFQSWPAEGAWMVNLKGACGDQNAGALVAVGKKGVIRESAKFFAHPATEAEVETSLKGLNPGGTK